MKPVYALLIVGSAFLAAPFGWDAYQNYHGICPDTGKRLSDEEIVEIASHYVATTDHAFLLFLQDNEVLGWSKVSAPQSETSDIGQVACCEIVSLKSLRKEEQDIVTPSVRMQGRFRAWVRAVYTLPDGTHRARLLAIENCGQFPSDLLG